MQCIIKVGDVFYTFDKDDEKNFIKFYKTCVILETSESLDMLFGSKKFRNAFCINYNCYRLSSRDGIGAQRQECGKCTENKADKIKDPETKDVEGLDIQFTPVIKNRTKGGKKIQYNCMQI